MMKSFLLAISSTLLFLLSSILHADEITMTLPTTCGFETSDLTVEIWNPPGGYAKVDSDKKVSVNVKTGHKLSVMVSPMACMHHTGSNIWKEIQKRCSGKRWMECCTEEASRQLFGKWTEANDGGELSVQCMP